MSKHHLTTRLHPLIEDNSSVGVGGAITTYLARIPEMTLGDTRNGVTFKGFEGGLKQAQKGSGFDPKSKDIAGSIGTRTLQHFTVTFDYGHRKLYLVKNKNFDAPFPMLRHGFTAPFGGAEHAVLSVMPNSPAAEAGMSVGDKIVSVDGVTYESKNLDAVRARLRQPAGMVVEIVIVPKGGGEKRSLKPTLRDLL